MRREARNDEDIILHSQSYLGSDAWGAGVASVQAIRSIRPLEADAAQLFYVYEDPTATDANHAVIRYTNEGPSPAKAYRKIARAKLKETFRLISTD